MKVAHQ